MRMLAALLAATFASQAAAEFPDGGRFAAIQLGMPLLAETYWSTGDFAGSASLDFPLSAHLDLALIAGFVDGTSYPEVHGTRFQLQHSYLAGGLRVSPRAAQRVRPYALLAVGPLQATLDSSFYDWQTGARSTTRSTFIDLTGLAAVGLAVRIGESRVSLTGEFSVLAPAGNLPGGGYQNVPVTAQLTAGARCSF